MLLLICGMRSSSNGFCLLIGDDLSSIFNGVNGGASGAFSPDEKTDGLLRDGVPKDELSNGLLVACSGSLSRAEESLAASGEKIAGAAGACFFGVRRTAASGSTR